MIEPFLLAEAGDGAPAGKDDLQSEEAGLGDWGKIRKVRPHGRAFFRFRDI